MENLPNDTSLPFFAYGLFRPGQLAFYQICKFVKNSERQSIPGELKLRDGIPILKENPDSMVYGILINFHDNDFLKAYNQINGFEPERYYRWIETTTLDNIKCNVLLGKSPDRGTSELDMGWDWRKDPYFTTVLAEIKSIIKTNQRPKGPKDTIPLIRLQMAYLMLWTSIERFATLKYNLKKEPHAKIMNIAKEEIYIKSLIKHVKEPKQERDNRVVSAADLSTQYHLNPNNPQKSLEYYYQIRSNVVHKGKALFSDYRLIKESLGQLSAIFEDMINYYSLKNSKEC